MKSKKLVMSTLALATLVSGFFAGLAYARQPHMEASINHLQNAKAELLLAEDNKGGHKVKAGQLIDEAISEVRAGIADTR